MPRGGKRTPGAGKKLGRPKDKKSRPVDGNVARKIKERVKAEELWIFLIAKAAEKAKQTGHTADLRNALEYLDDRDYGKPVIVQRIGNEEGEKLKLEVDVTSARDKLIAKLL